MLWNWQKKNGYTFIHPFDDPAVATGQGTIAMEIVTGASSGRLYPCTDRRRRTGNRCFHTCQAAESEDQGDRCGAGRSSLHEGLP